MAAERQDVEERLDQVSRFVSMHGGGVEVEQVSDDGRVLVRFTGMCTGCLYRPITMAATVRPALLEIDGITSVEAVGSRISETAERRLVESFAGHRTGIPSWSAIAEPTRVQ